MLHGQDTRRNRRLTHFFINNNNNRRTRIRTARLISLIVISLERSRLLLRARIMITTTIRKVKISTTRIARAKRDRIRRAIRGLVRALTARNRLNTSIRTLARLRIDRELTDLARRKTLANSDKRIISSNVGRLNIITNFTTAGISSRLIRIKSLRCTLMTRFLRRNEDSFTFVDFFWADRSLLPPLGFFTTLFTGTSETLFANVINRFLIDSTNKLFTNKTGRLRLINMRDALNLSSTTKITNLTKLRVLFGRIRTFRSSLTLLKTSDRSLTLLTAIITTSSRSNVILFRVRFTARFQRLLPMLQRPKAKSSSGPYHTTRKPRTQGYKYHKKSYRRK